jgi:hypothetical protein
MPPLRDRSLFAPSSPTRSIAKPSNRTDEVPSARIRLLEQPERGAERVASRFAAAAAAPSSRRRLVAQVGAIAGELDAGDRGIGVVQRGVERVQRAVRAHVDLPTTESSTTANAWALTQRNSRPTSLAPNRANASISRPTKPGISI